MSSDYDVIVLGGGLAGRALRGRTGRGRPARRGRRARAGRRRVLVLGVHPVQDAAAAGRGRPQRTRGGRERGGRRRSGARVARLHGLRPHRCRAAQWLADNGIDLLRGTGRLAGPGVVEVDGVRHTADHVVLANGADPVIPPVPGLRELDGVWTNREATAMTAVPRRLLILGGGPVGVEMAQAVSRLGGEAVIVDMADHVLGREPAPLGEALGEVLRRDGIELSCRRTRPPRDATATSTSSSSTTARSCAATSCSSRPAGVRGCRDRPGDGRRRARRARGSGRRAPARGRRAVGDRRRQRPLAADPRRQVPGRSRRRQHPRRAAKGQLRGGSAGRLHRPAGRGRRRRGRPLQRHGPAVGGGEDRHLHARVRGAATAS